MKRLSPFGFVLLGSGCATPPATPAVAPTPPASAASASPAPATADAVPAAAIPEAPKTPETPDALKVPAPAKLALKANAVGVQIYVCGPSKEPKHLEWTLKAPEATLADDAGKPIGKHYAGPTWEAQDGSKVVGAMKAKVDAPDAAAIPWLLVEAKSNEGQGAFGSIGWVQRVQTVGGKAPSTGCDQAHAGTETRVDYRATYYFYAR